MEKPIFNLVYVSVGARHFSRKELVELLEQSRKFNGEHFITGLLLYSAGHFMQLLEGPQDVVEELMVRITRDPRHRDVMVLEEGIMPNRQYPNWWMAFLNFDSPDVRVLPGYSTFLERDFPLAEIPGLEPRSLRLLQYFKAVMAASDNQIIDLMERMNFNPLRPDE